MRAFGSVHPDRHQPLAKANRNRVDRRQARIVFPVIGNGIFQIENDHVSGQTPGFFNRTRVRCREIERRTRRQVCIEGHPIMLGGNLSLRQ